MDMGKETKKARLEPEREREKGKTRNVYFHPAKETAQEEKIQRGRN